MVVDTRFELVTPAMSMQCSTAELIDRPKRSFSCDFETVKSSQKPQQFGGFNHIGDCGLLAPRRHY